MQQALDKLINNLKKELDNKSKVLLNEEALIKSAQVIKKQIQDGTLDENIYAKKLQEVDTLLLKLTGFQLHNLDLYKLDKEIKKTERKLIDRPEFKSLTSSLHTLRESIAADLDEQKNSRKNFIFDGAMLTSEYFSRNQILNSESCQLAKKAISLLQTTQFSDDTKETDAQAFKDFGKDYQKASGRVTNFFKAAWSVVVAGLTGILGTAALAITGPFALVGTYFGVQIGKDLGKKMTGLTAQDSIAKCLMFQPAPALAAKELSEVGMKLNESFEPTYQPQWGSVRG